MLNRYEPTQTTIQLSMIVVITSCAPTVPFSKPAIPARNAPASIAGDESRAAAGPRQVEHLGQLGRDQDGGDRAARYWPLPPMLKSPQRKANATARPTSTSTVQSSSVCWRFEAASEAKSSVFHGNQTSF